MAREVEVTGVARTALTGDEAERLFATVDETGHTNEESAERQRMLRREMGVSVEVDPLAGEDPSGANTDRLIARSAFLFVAVFLALVVVAQVGWGYVRRVTTATLAEDASMRSVVTALNMGVEWGGGFTQFPSDFSVQEADESSHRIEVTVVDSSSDDELDAFASAQVQASALAVNALLNPNIDTVIYHTKVHRADSGRFQQAAFFGFVQPTTPATPFMTFVWTKSATTDGVRFDCAITGVDAATQERLHDAITSKSTPATIINTVMQDSDAVVAQRVLDAAQDDESFALAVEQMAREAEQARLDRAQRELEESERGDASSAVAEDAADVDGKAALDADEAGAAEGTARP